LASVEVSDSVMVSVVVPVVGEAALYAGGDYIQKVLQED
jgi:hypothetical protein